MDFNGLNRCFFPLNHHPQKYRLNLAQWRNTGGLKQKHKKQACLISSRGLNQPHHITNAALLRGRWHRQKDKNRSPSRKTNLQKSDYPKTRTKRGLNALCVLECDNLYLCQIINIQCVILIIGGREISRPYQNVGYRLEKFDAVFYQEIMLSSGVFRRETASGFYPWGNVDSPRKRVAE